MDNGWSIKKLNKLIVMSGTYQQDSTPTAVGMRVDPTNQWLWRNNIQRLEFEELRDTLLTVSGKLDLTMGGQPFALAAASAAGRGGRYGTADLTDKNPNRRSVYGFIDRSALPEMLNTFDFANPDLSTGERILTTVPQQALFMMNSPFVVDQVKGLLSRPDFPAAGSVEDKVRFIFRVVFQRAPRKEELELAKKFFGDQPSASLVETVAAAPAATAKSDTKSDAKTAKKAFTKEISKPLNEWERYAQVLLLTNELIYVN
jgi:hypothetical protein